MHDWISTGGYADIAVAGKEGIPALVTTWMDLVGFVLCEITSCKETLLGVHLFLSSLE